MTIYKFHLVCPKCNKTSETTQNHKFPEPSVSCGDCLMDHVEVVGMTVTCVEKVK